MYQIEHIDNRGLTKHASEGTPSWHSRSICEGIMRDLYNEDRSYWPYGLNAAAHDDLYLIRKSASNEPIGFVGWQNIPDKDGKLVGYYSIGILPKHRKQGYAKEAVAKILKKNASQVDEVRAFIVQHNKPSIELAKKLRVPVCHG